jgi:ABC-type transporter Mla subunit MlaD
VRDLIQREAEALDGTARLATESIADVGNALRLRREELNTSTEEMRRAATEAEDSLTGRSRDVRETIESLLERWRELGDMLVSRAETLRETGESAVARTEVTMQALDRHTGELSTSADRMGGRVDSLRDMLREQARDMQSAIEQVAERAETVAATFRMQERALLEASEEAGRKAEEVRGAYIDSNRGVFLHTVNRVLDTLGSVGVEIDTLLQDGSAPDIMRRFSRGDRGVALRRLTARVKDPVAVARVRELYEDDDEFRTLTTRYLREFERLLTQAGEADPDELLSASLLTADVGKAYLLLSRAVERHR